jgi:hypothetical protein
MFSPRKKRVLNIKIRLVGRGVSPWLSSNKEMHNKDKTVL